MATQKRSLFQYLAQPNPVLNVENGGKGKGKNTRSSKGIWKVPSVIADWNDFRPDSLSELCDGKLREILSMDVSLPEAPSIAQFPFCEIHDEDSLESLLILWSLQIVSNGLIFAQENLAECYNEGVIYMARGGQAKLLQSSPKSGKRQRSHPDWAAVKKVIPMNGQLSKSNNFLPGDTKLSSKWTSSKVQRGDQDAFMTDRNYINHINPVMQVFNYCLKANARYGFIITDQELVVLRIGVAINTDRSIGEKGSQLSFKGFSSDDSTVDEDEVREATEGEDTKRRVKNSPDQKIEEAPTSFAQESQDSQTGISEAQKRARRSGKVELMSIPWYNHESDIRSLDSTLTVNLGLWWLHILTGIASGIDFDYPELSQLKFPTEILPTNQSFSSRIGDLDLATSFGSYNSEYQSSARKRKQTKVPDLPVKPVKRRSGKK